MRRSVRMLSSRIDREVPVGCAVSSAPRGRLAAVILVVATTVSLALAGSGLASSTAQARPSLGNPSCDIGNLCLYDNVDFNARAGAYLRLAVPDSGRWDRPLNLGH